MSYKIEEYSKEALKGLFAYDANTEVEKVEEKSHLTYLDTYLQRLGTKKIIAEFDYIDHDYLEDFTSYYVKCFSNYTRKCIRLHFFSNEFDSTYFDNILSTGDQQKVKDLNDSYLGFIVVKPLPLTVIGKTCLKTYPPESRRKFPITRFYDVSLFGIPLRVQSLAYQEQDSVAAACATSALWSIFHGTGILFHHPIPSPVEITRFATENLPAQSRTFPNKGLTIEQMAHAIRKVGMEPYYVGVSTEGTLKNVTYAYLRAKVPLMMAFHIVDISKTPHLFVGGHAVAITGDSIVASSRPSPIPCDTLLSVASNINKLYVHDDQVGPFAKMEFTGHSIKYAESEGLPETREGISLTTCWGDPSGSKYRAVPFALLVPVYNKIRIPFEVIEDRIIEIDSWIEMFRSRNIISLSTPLEWDISLFQVKDYKREVLHSSHFSEESRKRTLLANMPRFLWRALGSEDKVPKVELLFDATGIEQGSLFIKAIDGNGFINNDLIRISKIPAALETMKNTNIFKIFEWFSKK